MTSRALYTDLQNAIDFMTEAELVLYPNTLALTETTVGWHSFPSAGSFLLTRGHTTIEQYLAWVRAGAYSVILRDGSLLQINYEFDQSVVVGHRLAYIPCPVDVDELLLQAEPLVDVIDLYLSGGARPVLMKSPLRFDFEPSAARSGHPAAHFSVNSPECRIACLAPMHPYRFIDFVYRHFYPALRAVHEAWFDGAERRHLGARSMSEDDRESIHLAWHMP
jgi:hypothetical protein